MGQFKKCSLNAKAKKHSRSSSTMKTTAMPLAPSATYPRISEVRASVYHADIATDGILTAFALTASAG